jgi:hypothetical protein
VFVRSPTNGEKVGVKEMLAPVAAELDAMDTGKEIQFEVQFEARVCELDCLTFF